MIEAVIFDLDGLLIDSEPLWDDARERLTRDRGGLWKETAQQDMMGMSSPEWSRYMEQELHVQLSPEEISAEVVREMESLYRERLPLIDGAVEAVDRLSAWRLALASSANRPLIDLALELSGLDPRFEATVSSEEVERGKPAPDVYLEAARRLGIEAASCAAVEDSANGIRAGTAAGMRTIAVPNTDYPPAADALALADAVVPDLGGLVPAVVDPS